MQTRLSRYGRVLGEVLSLTLALTSVAQAQGGPASGPESKKDCVSNYEQAQVLRNSGNLREALDALVVCSQQSCHAAVRADCVQWHQEVRAAIPSVVISARSGNRDEFNVRVFVDGKLVANYLDGRPLELNPGSHKFRFETEKYPAEERQLLLVPGEKLRAISVTFGAQAGEAPPLPSSPPVSAGVEAPVTAEEVAAPEQTQPVAQGPSRPIPALTFVFGAVALAGVGSFAGFGLWAMDERDSLDTSCRPLCSGSDVDSVRTKLIIADASLGLALASAITATVFYINRPWVGAEAAPATGQSGKRHVARRAPGLAWLPRVDVDPVNDTAWVHFRGSF